MDKIETIQCLDEHAGMRLDKFLSDRFQDISRQQLQNLIKKGFVTLGGFVCVDPSYKIKMANTIVVSIPEPEESHLIPQDIEFEVIHQDEDLLVINKPAGLVVHPGSGNPHNTLANGLLNILQDKLSSIGGVKRPGIVHRLDKDTSGLMVVAKNDQSHQFLSNQFSDRTLKRTYWALAWGRFNEKSGTIETFIGRSRANRQKMAILRNQGKEAITHYDVIKTYHTGSVHPQFISEVHCNLDTGRTHQIRVHLSHLGHPIIGDQTYGNQPKGAKKYWPDEIISLQRQALHAFALEFIHPRTKELCQFYCDLPKDLQKIKEVLNKEKLEF